MKPDDIDIVRYVVMNPDTGAPAGLALVIRSGPSMDIYYEMASGARRGKTNTFHLMGDLGVVDDAPMYPLNEFMFSEAGGIWR